MNDQKKEIRILVINNNESERFSRIKDKYRLFDDWERALEFAKKNGLEDMFGFGSAPEVGVKIFSQGGGTDIMVVPLEVAKGSKSTDLRSELRRRIKDFISKKGKFDVYADFLYEITNPLHNKPKTKVCDKEDIEEVDFENFEVLSVSDKAMKVTAHGDWQEKVTFEIRFDSDIGFFCSEPISESEENEIDNEQFLLSLFNRDEIKVMFPDGEIVE